MAMQTRIESEQVEAMLDAAETEEAVFFGKDVIVCYKLPNGFTVIGRGACVDPANFNLELGRQIARRKAKDRLWAHLGYELQTKLSEARLGL